MTYAVLHSSRGGKRQLRGRTPKLRVQSDANRLCFRRREAPLAPLDLVAANVVTARRPALE